MKKRRRIFIAINLPENIRRELEKYQKKIQGLFASLSPEGDFAGPVKWTSKNNLHITLEFLGDLTDEELGEVCMIVKDVAQRHNFFSLNISQILYGPPKKIPPKMIWAEGEKSKELSALREDLENSLTEKVRFTPENRIFAPHVSLARIGAWEWRKIEPEERPEINENLDLIFTVESIEVMESKLKKGGPVYTVLESHNLKT